MLSLKVAPWVSPSCSYPFARHFHLKVGDFRICAYAHALMLSTTQTYTWEARSEHATEKAKKSRKQFGKDATLAEFTTEGKFDYEAARSASPFGSGFGLLAGSGTATTSKARNGMLHFG